MGKTRLEPQRPIAIDLFAGVGGLALGFEQAGFDVVVSVEYDPVHAIVHSYNFPLTNVLCTDLLTLPIHSLRHAVKEGLSRHGRNQVEWDGEIDVIFGGPPCQGFSTMGKRLIDDERNQLVFQFFRIITQLRPRYFVMENVPGMQQGGHSGILTQLIEMFTLEGYTITHPVRILNAADYGVPQDRKRLILLGARDDMAPLTYPTQKVVPVFKRARDQKPVSSNGLPLGPSVWDAIGDLPDLDTFDELLTRDAIELSPSLLSQSEQMRSNYAQYMREGINAGDLSDFSYPRSWDRHMFTSSMRTTHTSISIERFSQTRPGETEPVSRFYRLDPAGLSNTLRAGTGSERGAYTSARPIHPTLNRVISVREAARIHSFPDWFRFHTTKWHGFRQIGNAVPPLLGRVVGEQVMAGLQKIPIRPVRELELREAQVLNYDMTDAAIYFGAAPQTMPKPRQRLVKITEEVLSMSDAKTKSPNRYEKIIEHIFAQKYVQGAREVPFARTDIEKAASALGINLPKNLGDVIYSFRYRGTLPESIRQKAPDGEDWIIRGTGRAAYSFVATVPMRIAPTLGKAEKKIPNSTPGIIEKYALSDEQALLAILRYNRLIDIFTGVTCYSLQNHLRTTVKGMQVETDEVYIGVNRYGMQFVFPVQAKGGNDFQSIVQIEQDVAMCQEKFPSLICQPVAAQFMDDNLIALFRFSVTDSSIALEDEQHYRLVAPNDITDEEILTYRISNDTTK